MERYNDALLEDNVVDDNSDPNKEGSHLSIVKDISKMNIVQNKDSIMYDVIPMFLKEYTKYFQSLSKDLLFNYCACGYFKNAEAIIIEEIDKIKFKLDSKTKIEYINIIKKELIIKNMKTIVEMDCGVVYMLKNNQVDDLKWMYNFLSSVDGGVKVMFDVMRPYFREVGKSVLPEEEGHIDVNTCIKSLIDLKVKFDDLMVNIFNNDPLFEEIVGDEFDYFLKSNSLIPEYLSSFIDEKLRKGKYTYIKNNPEADIDKVIYMIQCLKKKDTFEYFYRIHLSNRLLHCKSASMDNENKMISKLNNAYVNGHGTLLFISKIKGMIADTFTLSKIIMRNYIERVEVNKCIFGISKSFGFEMDLKVITPVHWPVDPRSVHEIPSFGLSAFNEFKTIYKEYSNNVKKKLMLLPQFGTVELNAIFYAKPCLEEQFVNESSKTNIERVERKLELVVTTYQMCVLDLFNTHSTLTYEEIQSKTQIPKESLIKALHDMMELGTDLQYLLLKTPKGQEIKLTDKFYVNESFECI